MGSTVMHNPHAIAVILLAIVALFLYGRDHVPWETTSLGIMTALALGYVLFPLQVHGRTIAPMEFFAGFSISAMIAVVALMVSCSSHFSWPEINDFQLFHQSTFQQRGASGGSPCLLKESRAMALDGVTLTRLSSPSCTVTRHPVAVVIPVTGYPLPITVMPSDPETVSIEVTWYPGSMQLAGPLPFVFAVIASAPVAKPMAVVMLPSVVLIIVAICDHDRVEDSGVARIIPLSGYAMPKS
jgi:hypothetical protein